MIKIGCKENCTGCNACGDACSQNAISFVVDEEGFWYPTVDDTKCVQCGKCVKVCPTNNPNHRTENNSTSPACFVAEHKSIEVRFSSTTGGMFSALADEMYKKSGYVGGAIHTEDFGVAQYISNNIADLKLLRRSKDSQSDSIGFYKKVRELLDNHEDVLVCGLPCQIAALYNFLGKEYENLITIDLICAGINSPLVWRKYLDYIEEINHSKIVHTENKSKEFGWDKLTQKFVFENGEEYFDTRDTSFFIQGYIDSHLYCRPSCYNCKFKGFPRIADITIGDYWGLKKYSDKYNSNMGTNVVLTNSKKGEEYFGLVQKRVNCESTPLSWAVNGNPALIKSMSVLSNNRKEFFDDIKKEPFNQVVIKYSNKKEKCYKKFIHRIKPSLKFLRTIVKVTRLHPQAVLQTIRFSGVKNLMNKKGIICGTNCCITIKKNAQIVLDGVLVFGKKDKHPNSKDESKLYLGENARLHIKGNFDVDAGCDVVIFDDAQLTIYGAKNGYSDANTGLNIICGQSIEIMPDVGIGRNVSIRDTNGNSHYINTTGYRPSRPVIIGEKAWLCESCTIMPGVKIGKGAIVGVNSTVTKSVPAHSLVSGYPASVVQENVMFKL